MIKQFTFTLATMGLGLFLGGAIYLSTEGGRHPCTSEEFSYVVEAGETATCLPVEDFVRLPAGSALEPDGETLRIDCLEHNCVQLPVCSEGHQTACTVPVYTPLDDTDVDMASNVAMPGDVMVDCDSELVWCDDEGR